jgi:hypothetical protein
MTEAIAIQPKNLFHWRMQMPNPSSGQGSFELDNVTYDLITVLHEKSKGLEAYDKYLRDAGNDRDIVQCFERIREDDRKHIQELQNRLSQRLVDRQGVNKAA